MNVFRVELIIINHDGLSEQDLINELENANYPNDCISPQVRKIESKDIGEWDDNHPLNQHATQEAFLKELFNED